MRSAATPAPVYKIAIPFLLLPAATPITNSNQTNATDSPPYHPNQYSTSPPAMSTSSAPDVAESSRAAGKEPEQEPKSEPQRKWVALVSAAVLLGNDDQRAQEIGTAALLLDLKDPPLPSYLVLHPRVAPDPRRNDGPLSAYILAADPSACILLQVMEDNRPDFFLCNTHTRSVTILPKAVPYMRPHLSIGLIADPHHRGHYVLAQLHLDLATSSDRNSFVIRLLWYSTSNANGRWCIRGLNLPQDRMRNPFSETGVLAHDGRLWWLALAYGVFFCDPCTPLPENPQLRFLPLPDDCDMLDDNIAFNPRIRPLIDQRRCVRPSEGKLRFVEIRGLSYDELVDVPAANPSVWMWTLNDPEVDPNDAWTPEYEVAFAEIWDSESYADAGLPREVPHVALVDPNNHFVVYFLQGPKLFGFDMNEKKVVACKDCLIDRDQIRFPSSRPIVDAWEVPPPPPTLSGDDDDSSPDDNVWPTQSYDEQMKVIESVDSWLNQAHLEWTRDTDASVENWRAWQMAPPSSDESSVNSGVQADDELELQSPPSP